jgi:hypothetical protein
MKTSFSQAELKGAVVALNVIVAESGQESCLDGLTMVAYAFAGLLDIYSKPNPANPEGMCDDPAAFLKHFAELIEKGGTE